MSTKTYNNPLNIVIDSKLMVFKLPNEIAKYVVALLNKRLKIKYKIRKSININAQT